MATSRRPSSRRTRRNSPAIHARRDRQDDGERATGVRHEAIGIGHDPLAFGVASRRCIDGRNRDVDAMRIEAGPAGEACRSRNRRRSRHRERCRLGWGSVHAPRSRAAAVRSRRDRAIAAAPRRQPAVSPGCLERRSCGWSRLMYPLRATSKECPRGQTSRRSSRTSARWQSRTGQTNTLIPNDNSGLPW